jgi:DNA-binding sugar fermentation-stimulating protein
VRPPVAATFVRRDNRFVVTAALRDGQVVAAYLPNTARLRDVLTPGAVGASAVAIDRRIPVAWSPEG